MWGSGSNPAAASPPRRTIGAKLRPSPRGVPPPRKPASPHDYAGRVPRPRFADASLVTHKVPIRADTLPRLPNLIVIAVVVTGHDVWTSRIALSGTNYALGEAMDIHEYQAKELLSGFGVMVPPGGVAYSPEQAVYVATELGGWHWAIKAQIHAGGR